MRFKVIEAFWVHHNIDEMEERLNKIEKLLVSDDGVLAATPYRYARIKVDGPMPKELDLRDPRRKTLIIEAIKIEMEKNK